MMINLRRWPLFYPVVVAVIGLALTRTDLTDIPTACVLLALFIATLLWFRQYLLALLLMLGVLWGLGDLIFDASRVAVDRQWLNGDIVVTADVEKLEQLPTGRRYLLRHIRSDHDLLLPGKALLYQYRNRKHTSDVSIQAGQRISARVRWREPRNYRNPGAFDYRAWCFDRQVALIGSVRGSPEIIVSNVSWLEMQRQKVRRIISKVAAGHDNGVLSALLLGERAQITESVNRFFSASGTAHLLAISGMHIGMAAAWAFALVWFVLTRRESWIVRFPVRKIALFSAFLAAAAYASMAAWPLPAIRATVMLAAAALAWHLSSRSEPMNTLLAALALILLFDPSAIASLSLWLSFIATAALLLWALKLDRKEELAWYQRLFGGMRSLLWISLLATLATLPMIISTFGRIPVYSIPANMLMVPLYALFVMPAALLGELCALLGLDAWALGLMQFASVAVNQGLNLLSLLASLPAGELWAVAPSMLLNALYGTGMLLAGYLFWSEKQLRAAGVAAIVLTIYIVGVLFESEVKQPQWIVWDVGQGAASTLLLPGNSVVVVDAPGHSGSKFNGGTSVAAGLRYLGLSHIDVLVLSHAQSDHLGGALSLMRQVNSVGEVWLPDVADAHADKRVKAIETYAAEKHIPIHWKGRGDERLVVKSDYRLSLKVLWPPRALSLRNANNTSLVLLAGVDDQKTGGKFNLLWPGDIEIGAERALVNTGLEKVDAMLIPHHGSRSSSHQAFVQALQSDWAVAQAGFANRYGFPAKAVVERYLERGVEVKNTADGAVMIRWTGAKQGAVLQQWSINAGHRRDMARSWWQSWSAGQPH
ncbi:DNA internalization-related competence protein ComEC/Rec2 [Mariprofundus sp. EBB-1]|uniref:DNA internalization-related competence protein ComEC/Rec2 n=1 Tax=Mariprofundus sp. EBB-1 TaxID=2650971 RepID=UPI001911DBCF|nr:DNA internalization-related competence protein ComEC/Rec2 [Mariprofundus sp. EBB-1]